MICMNTNYACFLKIDISSYVGKWIAIVDNKIIASGQNAKDVYDEATKKSKERPLITKVPDKETMIL